MEKYESLESVSVVYLVARTFDSGYEGRAVVDAPRTTMSALFGAPDCFPADNRLIFSAEEKSRARRVPIRSGKLLMPFLRDG
jgi:hypothetical protein